MRGKQEDSRTAHHGDRQEHTTDTARASPRNAPAPSRATARRSAIRPLLWRLHFLGGMLAAPIVLSLAITGILYAWNPQIEGVLHDKALSATAEGQARPLSEQVAAARTERPGWELATVTPAAPDAPAGAETTGVTLHPPEASSGTFGQPEGATTVYVDPGSATVTGHIVEDERPDEWLRNLHSNWRLGPNAEPVTELAASWVLVSLLTGLYLWWPRGKRALRRAFRFRRPGRARWRSVHTTLGVVLSVGLLLLVGSGLTWTNYAGSWIDLARDQLRSEAPSVSTQLATTPRMGGNEQPGSEAGPLGADAGIDRVAVSAREAGLDGVVEFAPPTEPGQAWTAGRQDDRWPIDIATIAVDPANGQIIDRVDWDDYPLLAKATTLGIDFHQAQLFGLGTQIGLTVLALALIVLVVAGYRMWWLRRPPSGLGVPPSTGSLMRTAPIPMLIGFGVLLVLLPMLGVSFLLYLAAERLVRRRRNKSAADTTGSPHVNHAGR